MDLLAVAPCTGNTLSKIAAGITDTPVTMAVKSALRIGIPVVLCCATNDAMAASGPNLLAAAEHEKRLPGAPAPG